MKITRLGVMFLFAGLSFAPTMRAQGGDDMKEKAQEAMEEAQEKVLEEIRKQIPRFSQEAFTKWMKARKADPKILGAFAKEWEMGPDSHITDRAVRGIDKDYARATKISDSGDPKGALELARVLATSKDVMVRAHARYVLARVLLDEDDPEGAVEILTEFIRKNRGLTVLDAEAAFYLGYSLSLIPEVGEAIINLDLFLQLYPDAPERYRANAHDLLAELKAQWDSPLHQVADEMKSVERSLKKRQVGKEVETKQLEIVNKLQKLIEQLEQKQKQGPGGGPPKGNQQSNGPASESALPGGKGRIGGLHGSRGVKGAWGKMKDRDREKVLNDIQTRLPERYRHLLEKYYKKINK